MQNNTGMSHDLLALSSARHCSAAPLYLLSGHGPHGHARWQDQQKECQKDSFTREFICSIPCNFFGLISPHQHTILHPYLQASRLYKAEQWRCNCGYEMRFTPTRLCHCYALIRHPSIHGLEPRLRPTPAGQRPVRAETRIQKHVFPSPFPRHSHTHKIWPTTLLHETIVYSTPACTHAHH